MPYRLVVADLDGTLMGDNNRLSPAVLSAVSRVMEQGSYFTLATGRTFSGASPFIAQLRVNAPVILYQGGEIREAESGRLLYQATMKADCAREFIRWAQTQEMHLNVYVDDNVYVAKETPELQFYIHLNQVAVRSVGDLLRVVDRPPLKLLLIADPSRLDEVSPQLVEQFAGRLEIVRSHERFLEAIPAGVSKGSGLAWLAAYLDVSQEETVAIGDNDNDAEMVAWAGLGIAMGNASQATKAVADLLAPPVEQDGAAWALQAHVLESSTEHEHGRDL